VILTGILAWIGDEMNDEQARSSGIDRVRQPGDARVDKLPANG
jgi:hypothetical protein